MPSKTSPSIIIIRIRKKGIKSVIPWIIFIYCVKLLSYVYSLYKKALTVFFLLQIIVNSSQHAQCLQPIAYHCSHLFIVPRGFILVHIKSNGDMLSSLRLMWLISIRWLDKWKRKHTWRIIRGEKKENMHRMQVFCTRRVWVLTNRGMILHGYL